MWHASRLIASALLLGMVAASEAWAQPRTFVPAAPPAPQFEVRPHPPAPGLVWQPGYYRWRNGEYVWIPGVWAHPPARHALWVPPRWVHGHRGWYSTPGHWSERHAPRSHSAA